MAILDASAALASILGEPGAEIVDSHLPAQMSTVTFAETRAKLLLRGVPVSDADEALERLGDVVPLSKEMAVVVGDLVSRLRQYDFSLGDCCCLATGIVLGETVLTSDQEWLRHETGASVRLIR